MSLGKVIWIASSIVLLIMAVVKVATAASGDMTLSGPYSPDSDTVLLMHFDEGQGKPKDASGKGNDGINNGAKWVTGKFGSALQFNGEDAYIEVKDNSSLELNTSFTIELWVKLFDNTARHGLVQKGTRGPAGGAEFTYFFGISDASLLYATISSDGYAQTHYAIGGTVLEPNVWYHLAMVYDQKKGTTRFYINGKEDVPSRSVGEAFSVYDTSEPLVIGVYADGFLNGIIDEVRISNKMRSFE